MHLKTIGAGALCGLAGLVAGCADAMKRPETPAVMTLKQPNGTPVGAQAPGAVAANPPALRVGQPAGGPAAPFSAGASMQMPTAPGANPAVVTSMPVPNPGTYGLAQSQPAPAQPALPYNTPLNNAPVMPAQYQGAPVPLAAPSMIRPQATPPMQVSGIPPMMAVPPAMPPATSQSPAMLTAMPPALTMTSQSTNVAPTAVPGLPPLPTAPPTSAPPFPVIKSLEAVPAPSLPPLASGAGMKVPDLEGTGAQLPPLSAIPARSDMPAMSGGPKPTNFTELPPVNLFPEPGMPRR